MQAPRNTRGMVNTRYNALKHHPAGRYSSERPSLEYPPAGHASCQRPHHARLLRRNAADLRADHAALSRRVSAQEQRANDTTEALQERVAALEAARPALATGEAMR